jgi:carbamoyl-phosphate synthase large subunit
MIGLGVSVAQARTANSYLEGKEFAQEIGFPLVIRPSFTLGGTAVVLYMIKMNWMKR